MTERETRHADRLEAAHALLVSGLEGLVTSDDWVAMLQASRHFHTYSPSNVVLLMAQGAEGHVAGYRAWQRVAAQGGGTCQVARGARGMTVLAPVHRAVRDADTQSGEDETRRILAGFRPVMVFDERALVAPPAIPDVTPALLEGEGREHVFAAVWSRIETEGFAVTLRDCSPANGRTDWITRRVDVHPDLSAAQQVKTLAHELGHVLLHDPERDRGQLRNMTGERKEVEAESFAWMLCHEFGLETDAYTFAYVALWAGGDLEVVRATADRVINTARVVCAELGTALGRTGGVEPDYGLLARQVERDAVANLEFLTLDPGGWSTDPDEVRRVARAASDARQRALRRRPVRREGPGLQL